MPNSQNRSNGSNNAGKGQPKDRVSKTSSPKANPERSDIKHENQGSNQKGDTGRTSSQGRKRASGGSAED